MKARCGFGRSYDCKHPWPADCFVQCGDDGIVLPAETMSAVLEQGDARPVVDAYGGKLPGAYRTAFFEAFPRVAKPAHAQSDSIFLRGEGRTLLEAEDSCWRQWRVIASCPGHVIERAAGYTNGMARCKICGMMDVLMDPSTSCKLCGKPTNYYQDRAIPADWYCESCLDAHPPAGQPCHFCCKSDPPTTRMEPSWSKRNPVPGEGPLLVFMHPGCDE